MEASRLAVVRAKIAVLSAQADAIELELQNGQGSTIHRVRGCLRWGPEGTLSRVPDGKRAHSIEEAEAALFDISVPKICITGPAGSGKTELRRHLMRLAVISGPVACWLPTADSAAIEAKMRPVATGGEGTVDIYSTDVAWARPAPPYKFVFIDDLAEHNDPAAAVRIAMSRVAGYTGGKVIVAGADLVPGSDSTLIHLGGMEWRR